MFYYALMPEVGLIFNSLYTALYSTVNEAIHTIQIPVFTEFQAVRATQTPSTSLLGSHPMVFSSLAPYYSQ